MELNEQLTKAIIESTEEAIMSTISVPAKSIGIKTEFVPTEGECVICIMSLIDGILGKLAIKVPNEDACKIVSKMVDVEITEVTKDITDGIWQILNTIGESVKVKLSGVKDFAISVPTLLEGNELELPKDEDALVIVSGFECEVGKFDIILGYRIPGSGQEPSAPSQQAASEDKGEEKVKADVSSTASDITPEEPEKKQTEEPTKEPISVQPQAEKKIDASAALQNAIQQEKEEEAKPDEQLTETKTQDKTQADPRVILNELEKDTVVEGSPLPRHGGATAEQGDAAATKLAAVPVGQSEKADALVSDKDQSIRE